MIVLYTDGACSNNPGPGGWAFALIKNQKAIYQESGGISYTTNNRMELLAILKGLLHIQQNDIESTSIMICTDSSYSLNALKIWIHKWKANGWKRDKNKPIENLDLMKELYPLIYQKKWNVQFKKVKAHQPKNSKDYDPFNDLVDQLASYESKRI